MKNKISYLVLDYMRPVESELCLRSLRENTKFDCPIIYLSNGGRQDYVFKFYEEGLIDKLILNKENEGLGYGTTDLFKICKSKYAIYVQNDQYLGREYTEEELDKQIETLIDSKMHMIKRRLEDLPNICSISLAGDQCQGKYSERAHIIETHFYNSIKTKPNGGAGPYHHVEWNEGFIQKFYEEKHLTHYIWPDILFGDNGAWAYRKNPDGSEWRHRTDHKTLWLIKGPVKEKYVYPKFNDEEWADVLATQTWEDGKIPEQEKKDSFKVWL